MEMPRSRTTASRLDGLEKSRKKVETKLKAAPTKRTVHEELPGEREWKKQMAVVFKVAGLSHGEIGDAVGVSRGTVGKWFEEPLVQQYFQFVTEHMVEGGLMLLRSYALEAIKRIRQLMIQTDDPRLALEAAKEILDRCGLPKMSRVEKKEEHAHSGEVKFTGTHEHVHSGHLTMEQFQALPPNAQKEIADVWEEADRITAAAVANGEPE